jgi:hypothetical protein
MALALRGEEMGPTHHYLQLVVDDIALSFLCLDQVASGWIKNPCW